MSDETIFTGVVSDEHLAALYRTAAISVAPSRFEGYGLPIVEARLTGAPVLAARCSSFIELMPDEALFDPDDESDLAERLSAVLHRRSGCGRASLDPDPAGPHLDRGRRPDRRGPVIGGATLESSTSPEDRGRDAVAPGRHRSSRPLGSADRGVGTASVGRGVHDRPLARPGARRSRPPPPRTPVPRFGFPGPVRRCPPLLGEQRTTCRHAAGDAALARDRAGPRRRRRRPVRLVLPPSPGPDRAEHLWAARSSDVSKPGPTLIPSP